MFIYFNDTNTTTNMRFLILVVKKGYFSLLLIKAKRSKEHNFFFGLVVYWLELTQLNVEKWGVWGSNPSLCINYAMSLPTELSSRGRKELNSILSNLFT
jgi:hypothetical protein